MLGTVLFPVPSNARRDDCCPVTFVCCPVPFIVIETQILSPDGNCYSNSCLEGVYLFTKDFSVHGRNEKK
jgi:hypothetical protein